jgi:hypothetical protein
MSDFHNILSHDSSQQQQYSLMRHALVGVPHDELQHPFSGFGTGDDFTPSWNPPAGYFDHLHGLHEGPSQVSPRHSVDSYAVTGTPSTPSMFASNYYPPTRSPSPYLPTIRELLDSTPSRTAPKTICIGNGSNGDSSSEDLAITVPKGKGTRTLFTCQDIRKLMAVVCEVNPYMAGWGKIGKKWVEVCEKTRAVKACLSHSNSTIQHKVTALLDYQKVRLFHCCIHYSCHFIHLGS